MKEYLRKNQKDSILESLINKYRIDPEGFRSYLPEVTQELEKFLPRQKSSGHSTTLTEPERDSLHKALIQLLDKGNLSTTEAIHALEYCATLVQDESLPGNVDRKVLLSLLRQAVGTSLSNFERNSTIQVTQGEAVKEVAVLRGTHLHLTWNDRLVAISIFPEKSKERSSALKFVGLAQDTAADVSQRHDIYLAEVIE